MRLIVAIAKRLRNLSNGGHVAGCDLGEDKVVERDLSFNQHDLS